jgi:hypothetical protein
MRNLQEYDFVGILERYEDSISRLCRELGLAKTICSNAMINVNSARPRAESIAPEIIQRIEEMNALDCELYSYALLEFDCSDCREPASGNDSAPVQIVVDQDAVFIRHKDIFSEVIAEPKPKSWDGGVVCISTVEFGNDNVHPEPNVIQSGGLLEIRVMLWSNMDLEGCRLAIIFRDFFGNEIYLTSTHLLGCEINLRKRSSTLIRLSGNVPFRPGVYSLAFIVYTGRLDALEACWAWREYADFFWVEGFSRTFFNGEYDISLFCQAELMAANDNQVSEETFLTQEQELTKAHESGDQ